MSLTTPELRDFDASFPGENWFLYWKTSAALWKNKLQEFPGSKIIVPINWSFHSETGDTFDFEDNRPETNLKKLVDCAHEVGKEIAFLLPLTPAPFLPNGGVPFLLARTVGLNQEGMAYGIVDSENHLNKVYSFYDVKVFQAFDRFVKKLGQYFTARGVNADVWGMRCGFIQDGKYHTFLDDTSKAFETAFTRFLDAKKEERVRDENGELIPLSALEEKQYIHEFGKVIQNLYFDSAKHAMNPNWEGVIDVAFLGASPEKFLKRMSSTISISEYTTEIFDCLCKDVLPSSILLSQQDKHGVLGRELKDLVANSYVYSKFSHGAYEESAITAYEPLSFFHIYESQDGLTALFDSWNDYGLWNYLKDNFQWTYKVRPIEELSKKFDDRPATHEKIHFIHGHDVDRNVFQFILKTFMSGGKIILNRSGLSDEFQRKIETFFIENSLKVERVNFQTLIENATLGDGRLLIFNGDQIDKFASDGNLTFWQRILETFQLQHLKIPNSEGIDFYWRTKASSSYELKFDEIRRLNVYNPTSYKKRLQMNLAKNFAVLRVIDEINVTVQTRPNELELEILPEGSVMLDFGVYS